jgi:hypothetical protein
LDRRVEQHLVTWDVRGPIIAAVRTLTVHGNTAIPIDVVAIDAWLATTGRRSGPTVSSEVNSKEKCSSLEHSVVSHHEFFEIRTMALDQ